MRSIAFQYAGLAACLVLAFPAAAVQRTFVASYGSDANAATNCGFTNPCRGFQAAHNVTDPGGEIIAIDAAGYGAITVTKSISLIGNSGFYAGISVASGNGITIATPSVKVILRGLNINGIGGPFGVNMTDGASLTVENCVFSNFTGGGGAAINVAAPAQVRITNTTVRDNNDGIRASAGANVSVSQSKVFGNGDAGIFALTQTAATTSISVTDSVVTNNFVGIGAITGTDAGALSKISVTRTTSSNNSYGVFVLNQGAGTPTAGVIDSMFTHNAIIGLNNSGGVLETLGRNFVRYNASDTAGVITAIPAM